MSTPQVELIEELAVEAWPAAVVEACAGWRLRWNHGVTGRANSVWPNGAARRLDLAEKVARAEAFYARYAAPVRFQISPAAKPSDLDQILAARGYGWEKPTLVQTARLAEVVGRTAIGQTDAVTIRHECDDDWLRSYCRFEGISASVQPVYRVLFQRIEPRTAFALARNADDVAAVALGVLDRGYLGIFCVATDQRYRRQGLATTLMAALGHWAVAEGAEGAYLQVNEQNVPARALYARLGFETLYGYHYRVKPKH